MTESTAIKFCPTCQANTMHLNDLCAGHQAYQFAREYVKLKQEALAQDLQDVIVNFEAETGLVVDDIGIERMTVHAPISHESVAIGSSILITVEVK